MILSSYSIWRIMLGTEIPKSKALNLNIQSEIALGVLRNHAPKIFYKHNFLIFLQLCSIHLKLAQMVRCLPTMRETRVQPLGQEDLLEKEMATHSSIFAWTEEPGRL